MSAAGGPRASMVDGARRGGWWWPWGGTNPAWTFPYSANPKLPIWS